MLPKPEIANPQWTDPQSLLYLAGRYLEHMRVRHFSPRSVYRRERELARFRRWCEALGISQARQITRGVVLNYQSHLYHYRKADGAALAVGTQKQWMLCLSAFFSYLTREEQRGRGLLLTLGFQATPGFPPLQKSD